MHRSKRNSWQILVLMFLISTIALCSVAYAQEQNEDWQTSVAEKKQKLKQNSWKEWIQTIVLLLVI